MAIGIQQKARLGDTPDSTGYFGTIPVSKNLGYISATLTYENVANAWLGGVKDAEGNTPNNWIRSGSYVIPAAETPWHGINMNDYVPEIDKNGVFEKILEGTWAPYFVANKENSANSGIGLVYSRTNTNADRNAAPIGNCSSVDIVFTADRNKWTRCSVIEMSEGSYNSIANGNILSQNGAWKYNLRNHPSLEKEADAQGKPVYSSTDSGHSWFPGYAVNLETGERLNIVFGEDSGDPLNNGADMMYNPTNVEFDPINFRLRWGGHHAVYISSSRYDAQIGGADFIYNSLKSVNGLDAANNTVKRKVYGTMMWVSPTLNEGKQFNSWKDGLIPTNTTIKIRVHRPYGYDNPGNAPLVNLGLPVYQFDTKNVIASKLNEAGNQYNNDEDGLLSRLNVVPNPYYAYSEYETSRLDNRIKIINLPEVATIKIYSTDGALIKTINKSDAATTYVEWDVNNEKGVPVASGLYLIHIKIKTDQGEKERVLKWFGIMRPTDLTTF